MEAPQGIEKGCEKAPSRGGCSPADKKKRKVCRREGDVKNEVSGLVTTKRNQRKGGRKTTMPEDKRGRGGVGGDLLRNWWCPNCIEKQEKGCVKKRAANATKRTSFRL